MKLSSYKDKPIAFATKHEKEKAVAKHFQKHLQATLILPIVDTDLFGTFSGEIERKDTPLKTLEDKARAGMKASGLPYGLASEGSFGPNPHISFLYQDIEQMVFIDDERNIKIFETLISKKTNFSHICVHTKEEANTFLKKALFPSHGIIVRPNYWEDKNIIFKNIKNFIDFEKAFSISKEISSDKKVWLETDMRAYANPTRMRLISILGYLLAKRLSTCCPLCFSPGWGYLKNEQGLPCEYCHFPTEMVRYKVFGCNNCSHQKTLPRKDKLKFAPQIFCTLCNP